jgi:hypothetical protein
MVIISFHDGSPDWDCNNRLFDLLESEALRLFPEESDVHREFEKAANYGWFNLPALDAILLDRVLKILSEVCQHLIDNGLNADGKHPQWSAQSTNVLQELKSRL